MDDIIIGDLTLTPPHNQPNANESEDYSSTSPQNQSPLDDSIYEDSEISPPKPDAVLLAFQAANKQVNKK